MNSWPILVNVAQCTAISVALVGTLEAVVAQELAGGSGSFEFVDPQGNPDRPIKIWYHRPESFQEDGSILFLMHGGNRNASSYRKTWIEYAERDGHLLLCPEFSKEYYPDYRDYQWGNVTRLDGTFRHKNQWAFSAIERIFDRVVDANQLQAKQYSIYGHSGGGQFVHRLVLFLPEARFKIAIAANPGMYTMLQDEVTYPYGLAGSSINEPQLRKSLDRQFVLLLGTADTEFLGHRDPDSEIENPRESPEAMAQGPNRFARGKVFFENSQLAAENFSMQSSWRMQWVEGVSHNNSEMSNHASKLLRTWEEE